MSEQDKEVEKLKALKLHERCQAGVFREWEALRVPGGFIYTRFNYNMSNKKAETSVFVPDHTLALVRYENEPLAPIYKEEKPGITRGHDYYKNKYGTDERQD